MKWSTRKSETKWNTKSTLTLSSIGAIVLSILANLKWH
jgi:hypothetical protein